MRPLVRNGITIAAIALLAAAHGRGDVAAQRGEATGSPATPNVVRISKYSTRVDNLEKTVAFYRDAFGIQLSGRAGIGTPSPLDERLAAFADVPPGTRFRSVYLSVPGGMGAFGYELTEFTGPPRASGSPRIQDPGASVLFLTVADVPQAVAKVRAAGGTVVTPGNGVAKANASSGSLVRDLDGAFIALVQGSSSAPAARFGYVVADAEQTAKFYRDHLGLVPWPDAATPHWSEAPTLAALAGLAGVRRASVIAPGTATPMDLFDFPGANGKASTRNISDPGMPAVSIEVRSAANAVTSYRNGGGTVVSGKGTPVPGLGYVFVRDPGGVLAEIIQVGGR